MTKHLNANIKQPKVLLCYDYVNGITYEEEKNFLQVESELFTIGTITLPKPGILVLHVALETSLEELKFIFLHTQGEILINEVIAHLNVQDLKIARWTLQEDVQVRVLNMNIVIEL